MQGLSPETGVLGSGGCEWGRQVSSAGSAPSLQEEVHSLLVTSPVLWCSVEKTGL